MNAVVALCGPDLDDDIREELVQLGATIIDVSPEDLDTVIEEWM